MYYEVYIKLHSGAPESYFKPLVRVPRGKYAGHGSGSCCTRLQALDEGALS
jgi:hypothetical protein